MDITNVIFGLCMLALAWSRESKHRSSHCVGGRTAIVHLFEWRWLDVARECEAVLAPMGYCAVQISPPQECAVIREERIRPWWERYQPVSYKLISRSGSEAEFQEMVERCNRQHIRIYVDLILNHMTGASRAGQGTAGTPYDGATGYFPGVPYHHYNFNSCPTDGKPSFGNNHACPTQCCCITDWSDDLIVRNCRLVELTDLDTRQQYVRQKQATYLNHMISLGVAGFRVDAAKHIWPDDLEAVLDLTMDLSSKWFPVGSRAYVYHEVIDRGQHNEIGARQYAHLGRVTDFTYSNRLKQAVSEPWNIPDLLHHTRGVVTSSEALVFVDNHDSQRGHASGDVYTHRQPREYTIAQGMMLAWGFGHPRVMSSYYFTDTEAGPPTRSEDTERILGVYEDDVTGSPDDVIPGPALCKARGWVCEHRWRAIAGMVSFAKAVAGAPRRYYWSHGDQAGWARGDRGFFAMTQRTTGMDAVVYTGLPPGRYCNVIQSCPTSDGCGGDGQVVVVGEDRRARLSIQDWQAPLLAIHVDAMYGSGGCTDTSADTMPDTSASIIEPGMSAVITEPGTSADPNYTSNTDSSAPLPTITDRLQRTLVFMRASTVYGDYVFMRGGIDHCRRTGCQTGDVLTSACAVTITHTPHTHCTYSHEYTAWRTGDTRLDWSGTQTGQGSYQGQQPQGSPTCWTSDQVNSGVAYTQYNRWGAGYWLLDVMMDCDETEGGWFEVKAVVMTSLGDVIWERDVMQEHMCTGDIPMQTTTAYTSRNHVARCGAVNVFQFNSDSCGIYNL